VVVYLRLPRATAVASGKVIYTCRQKNKGKWGERKEKVENGVKKYAGALSRGQDWCPKPGGEGSKRSTEPRAGRGAPKKHFVMSRTKLLSVGNEKGHHMGRTCQKGNVRKKFKSRHQREKTNGEGITLKKEWVTPRPELTKDRTGRDPKILSSDPKPRRVGHQGKKKKGGDPNRRLLDADRGRNKTKGDK